MRNRETSAERREVLDRRLTLLAEQTVPRAAGGEWWSEHTHPRPEPSPLHLVEPTLLPSPGRHASRRPGDGLGAALERAVPETLRGRVRIGASHLTVVAVLVAVGLAFVSWQVIRGEPERLTPVSADTEPMPTPSGAAGSDPDAATETVTVDVAGRVRRPGIVVLPAGSRVVDALEKAGGVRRGVNTTSLNLARPLVDGEQVLVGLPATATIPGVPGVPAAPGGVAAPGSLVNLNLADQAALEALPDVGPVTAAAIIAWRTEHGAFTAVTELLEVDGIGDATLATLTPLVTV